MYKSCKTTLFTTIVLMLSLSSLAQNIQPKQAQEPIPTVIAFTLFFDRIIQTPELATKACSNPSDALGLIVDAAKFNRSLFALLRARRAVTPAEQSALVRTALAELQHDLSAAGFQQFQKFFETQKSDMYRTFQRPASDQLMQTF